MPKCPIQNCGRQFDNDETMLEHAKRRHPTQFEQIQSQVNQKVFNKQQEINEEMMKLPKMNKIIKMSAQKRPIEFHRKSLSKKNQELKPVLSTNHSQMSEIIKDSRNLIESQNHQSSHSKKMLKRPSLSKKTSSESQDNLPSISQIKGRKLKLDLLKSESEKQKSQENSSKASINKTLASSKLNQQFESLTNSHMRSTAPDFHRQFQQKKLNSIRSRSKGKQQQQQQGEVSQQKSSRTIQEKVIKRKVGTGEIADERQQDSVLRDSTKEQVTIDSTIESKRIKSANRPIPKKLLQRKNSTSKHKVLEQQPLSDSVFIEPKQNILEQQFDKKEQLSFKGFNKKSNTKSQQAVNNSIKDDVWNEAIVNIKNCALHSLEIPSQAEVEYLFVKNCELSAVNLNECFSLLEVDLSNNNLTHMNFLTQSIEGGFFNLESLYMDRNKITSLETLPTYLKLKKLSLTFNSISDLQSIVKVLAKIPTLQVLDLSFNEVRKSTNYKFAVLSACKNLVQLDGMKVTKIDRQIASEYRAMHYRQLNLIPLQHSPQTEKDYRPSTAVSINYQQDFEIETTAPSVTEEQLDREIQSMEKVIKQTKDQFEIIQNENYALSEEIQQAKQRRVHGEQVSDSNPKLYKKLTKEVQELQLLNFLQYASEEELQQIIEKKLKEYSMVESCSS